MVGIVNRMLKTSLPISLLLLARAEEQASLDCKHLEGNLYQNTL